LEVADESDSVISVLAVDFRLDFAQADACELDGEEAARGRLMDGCMRLQSEPAFEAATDGGSKTVHCCKCPPF